MASKEIQYHIRGTRVAAADPPVRLTYSNLIINKLMLIKLINANQNGMISHI